MTNPKRETLMDLRKAVVDAARLPRNTRITDDDGLAGDWVAVPKADFDALCAALARLDSHLQGGKP